MEGPITTRGISRRLGLNVGGGVALDCHPTKKRTRGRLRHFRDARRETALRMRYEALLNTMLHRFARAPA